MLKHLSMISSWNAKPVDTVTYVIWLVQNYMLCPPHSLLAQNTQSAMLLEGRMHRQGGCLVVFFRTLFDYDYWGVVDRLHDSGQATAQVVGLVDMDFGRVFKHYSVSWTVQNPGQKLAQLYLQWVWTQRVILELKFTVSYS